MRIHYLQQVPFENAANIGTWAIERGYSLSKTELFKHEPFPTLTAIDMLAIMGGPMNVYQYRDYPWLKEEKYFIEQAIAQKIKVIGVCLGAQLIADVLGARIIQNTFIEIGWHDIKLTNTGKQSNFFQDFPQTFTVFHWHGDTFDIPAGASHLATSEACINQAFKYDNNVIGLQFHLEYSQDSIEKMLSFCSHEIINAPYVQQKERIRQGYSHINGNKQLLNDLLNVLCK